MQPQIGTLLGETVHVETLQRSVAEQLGQRSGTGALQRCVCVLHEPSRQTLVGAQSAFFTQQLAIGVTVQLPRCVTSHVPQRFECWLEKLHCTLWQASGAEQSVRHEQQFEMSAWLQIPVWLLHVSIVHASPSSQFGHVGTGGGVGTFAAPKDASKTRASAKIMREHTRTRDR